MMRNVIRSFGTLAVLLAAISASAQTSTRVRVPFAFAAAGQTLPAGDYRVSLNESTDLVSLRGPDRSSIFFLTIPDNRFQDERRVLRFRRYGNEWSLQEIALDGMTHRLPSAKTKNKLIATQDYSDQKVIVGVAIR
jgi:hypothetical protein